ncbi:MAG: hypothetical protein N2749_00490 [Clostridia bacterium]|nr:hypothetical protein [Clostridia bacterium]
MSKDYLIKCYKEHFKEMLMPLNFIIKGKYFYRVIGSEIIQVVGIEKHRLRRVFTININFKPFCMGFDVRDLIINGERLGMFLYSDDLWWDFDENNISLINYKIEHVANEFKKILYLFEKIVDTKSYYEIVSEIEKKIYGDVLFGYDMLYLYLKLKMYDEALLVIGKIENDMNNWFNQQIYSKKTIDKDQETKLILKAEELFNFLEYRNIREAILQGDFSFIDDIIKRNEHISKQSCQNYLKITL